VHAQQVAGQGVRATVNGREVAAGRAEMFAQSNNGDGKATLDAVELRVAELNREVGGWQAAHLRVWSTFGPSPGSVIKSGGMGGAMAVLPLVFANEPPALPQALALLSSSVSESGQSLRALERYVERTRPALMALPLRWPVRGLLNSRFGMRPSPWTGESEFHRGLDISAQRGTPVRAPASGVVAFAGNGGEYGNTVILDHGRDPGRGTGDHVPSADQRAAHGRVAPAASCGGRRGVRPARRRAARCRRAPRRARCGPRGSRTPRAAGGCSTGPARGA